MLRVDQNLKILITGGAGFIGSAVAREVINQSNDEVIIVDRLTYAGNLENLAEISNSARYRFECADICDAVALQDIFQRHRPNVVMHLAAESHVDRSIDGPASFIQTNLIGTFNLLEVVRNYISSLSTSEAKTFRFHHVSTDEVYGDLPHPDETNDAIKILFTEETPYSPSSPYSATKAGSDHLVRAWFRTYQLPIIITNCSNNYGPYHHPEKLIPHTIICALQGKNLPIYGSGHQIRDWLFVEDHARALLTVLRNGEIGETYNIGGFNEYRNIDVVKTICSILDDERPNSYKYSALIKFVPDRAGHDKRYAIDASKISVKLGWKPKETFTSGMQKTVRWYLTHENWWRNVINAGYHLTRLGEEY